DGGVTGQRNHRVAVAAENECGDVFSGHAKLFSDAVDEARAVENASHTDDLVGRQARELLQRPDHGVERVGDADHESIRCVLGDACTNLLHNLEVDFEQVVTAHARLAGYTGGHDDNV